ncbi:hypothetical protein BV898_18291 [Hypsibius exemplaris]|uniref:Uncharacterized protein n=1 Tax=Hypsibius exemplaris TaxID=2072580 RepID=A0A9X6RNC9_HYPEX|nr:hypothetical protein BV898_18291 [Hypsibius exemplaris]
MTTLLFDKVGQKQNLASKLSLLFLFIHCFGIILLTSTSAGPLVRKFHRKTERRHQLQSAVPVDSVELQAGDFAGDYQLELGKPDRRETRQEERRETRQEERRETRQEAVEGRERSLDFGGNRKEQKPERETSQYQSDLVQTGLSEGGVVTNQVNEEQQRRDELDGRVETDGRAPWELSAPLSEETNGNKEFDDPPPADTHDQAQHGAIADEVHKLEAEIKKLESQKDGAGGSTTEDPTATVKTNLTFNLKWKQYKNLTDVDTMELHYKVSGKDSATVQIIFFILIPSFLLILALYLAVTLYWTKCWFWKVVPPDRFYQFERYEIEQDEDPSDLAPLLKTPLEALHDAELREQARQDTNPEEKPVGTIQKAVSHPTGKTEDSKHPETTTLEAAAVPELANDRTTIQPIEIDNGETKAMSSNLLTN